MTNPAPSSCGCVADYANNAVIYHCTRHSEQNVAALEALVAELTYQNQAHANIQGEQVAALTAELERYKAFVREIAMERRSTSDFRTCWACRKSAWMSGPIDHKSDCLYVAAGGK